MERSLCHRRLLQGQARRRVAVIEAWQQAHEVLAVPGQAAAVRRTGQQPPTRGSTVALQMRAREGRREPWGCGRNWSGCHVPENDKRVTVRR